MDEQEKQTNQELKDAVLSEDGIISERFDGPVTLPSDEGGEELEETIGVAIDYAFTPEEIKEALLLFQKKTIYRKNILFTGIIAVLFFVYLAQLISDGANTFNRMICIISVCVIAMIWYFPLQHVRQVVKAMRLQEDEIQYHMTIFPNAIRIGQGETASTVYYKDGQLQFWETEQLLVLGYAKQRLFALPKRCFPDRVEEVRRLLSEGLGG